MSGGEPFTGGLKPFHRDLLKSHLWHMMFLFLSSSVLTGVQTQNCRRKPDAALPLITDRFRRVKKNSLPSMDSGTRLAASLQSLTRKLRQLNHECIFGVNTFAPNGLNYFRLLRTTCMGTLRANLDHLRGWMVHDFNRLWKTLTYRCGKEIASRFRSSRAYWNYIEGRAAAERVSHRDTG